MTTQTHIIDVSLIPIGNSKGIRLPKILLQKYGLSDDLILQETEKGILLRSRKPKKHSLSWEESYKQMAKAKEDWDDFDNILMDGLE